MPGRPRVSIVAARHSGTHLIRPMIKHLGMKVVSPKGEMELAFQPNPAYPLLVFLRNPRNTLTSFYRWKFMELPDDEKMAYWMITPKGEGRRSPLGFYLEWARVWGQNSEPLLFIRFEELVDPDQGRYLFERIAEALRAPCDPDTVFARHFRGGTFTGQHSNWETMWGPLTRKFYRRAGGCDIDRWMGYTNAE